MRYKVVAKSSIISVFFFKEKIIKKDEVVNGNFLKYGHRNMYNAQALRSNHILTHCKKKTVQKHSLQKDAFI